MWFLAVYRFIMIFVKLLLPFLPLDVLTAGLSGFVSAGGGPARHDAPEADRAVEGAV